VLTPERRGMLFVAAAALLWSSGGLGIKAIPEPPLTVACYRSAVATMAMALIFRPPRWRPTLPFLVAVVSYAACLTTFVVATKWTTAANAIFLQYSGVVWVVLLSPLVLGEALRLRDLGAVACAFVGMALFFADRLEFRARAGDAVAVLSGVCFAAVMLSLRRERDGGAIPAVVYGNLLLVLCLLAVGAGRPAPGPRSAAILLALGVFQIALPYVFFVRGLRLVTATQAALVGMLEPVANPVWVFLGLGERPTGAAIAGAAIVLGAIGWRTLAAPPATPVPAPD
jgi:drug/metabolite transporter (DMT)-like permease